MKLIATRGLQGSGKTTNARAWVGAGPNRARVNRDDLRGMFGCLPVGTPQQEKAVTTAQHAAVTALLKRGVDVVCDDTNLRARYLRDLRAIAVAAGAEFEVWDLTNVPLDVCIARDAARERPVGEKVIRDWHARYIAGRPYPLPLPDEPADTQVVAYEPKPGTPPAILVDLDGTVALMNGRSPYPGPDGEDRCGEDQPNLPVIAAVQAMWRDGHEVVFMSGRTEACRSQTEMWLRQHVLVGAWNLTLFMRAAGDQRPDRVVKLELFDRHVRDVYDVRLVFDDRATVVAAWRALGLTVCQVAPGAF